MKNQPRKILIDIKHPAQLNLFKGLSKELSTAGWDVTISYLGRGKLPAIIQKEYPGFNNIQVGASHGSKWSIFWEGNVKRTFRFFQLIGKNKYNICISASSVPLAFAGFFATTPVIQFYDDPERKRINQLNALLSKKIFFPPVVTASKKVGVFNCLKEWSYLSPDRFSPSTKIMETYGLESKKYVFIREVSNKSFNYFNQQDAIIQSFAHKIQPGTKVVLSLEDKSLVDKYPKDWILLKEPVGDIHSLIYHAATVISSGDSMAREGAMLGVKSVYCGIREMKANQLLEQEGLLVHLPLDTGIDTINKFIRHPHGAEEQIAIREKLKTKWTDMVDFMTTQINTYKK
ncbi:MAG: DUF354 domain-containing protein [Chitinophagaceae bacterium]